MSPPIIANTPPGVAPLIQVGIGDRYDASAIAGLWDTARWSTPGNENEWSGTEPLWNDITCEVLDVGTFIGRDGSADVFDVGTATVTVRNLDGWADYKPPPPGADNLLTIRPGRQCRVGVAFLADGVPHWLWRGVIDTTTPGYQPGEGDVVTFGCIDAKGDAGRAKMPRALTPVGAGEPAYYRISRTLDNIKWPKWRRALDVDDVQLHPTEFGTSAAAELDRTAESASGHVYGDLNGRVCFRRKDWMFWNNTAPVQATIGNVEAGDICPSGWEVRFGRDDITTRAIVGRTDETPLVVDDAEAVGLYGVEPFERSDLLPISNEEMSRIATRVLSARSPDVMPRIASVTLNASTGSGEVAQLLASCSAFTPSRLRCRHRAADGRLVFDRTMLVVGIRHTISPAAGWTARITLDDALPYQQGNPARWSDPASLWSTDDEWAFTL
jgi:hypothetical protein